MEFDLDDSQSGDGSFSWKFRARYSGKQPKSRLGRRKKLSVSEQKEKKDNDKEEIQHNHLNMDTSHSKKENIFYCDNFDLKQELSIDSSYNPFSRSLESIALKDIINLPHKNKRNEFLKTLNNVKENDTSSTKENNFEKNDESPAALSDSSLKKCQQNENEAHNLQNSFIFKTPRQKFSVLEIPSPFDVMAGVLSDSDDFVTAVAMAHSKNDAQHYKQSCLNLKTIQAASPITDENRKSSNYENDDAIFSVKQDILTQCDHFSGNFKDEKNYDSYLENNVSNGYLPFDAHPMKNSLKCMKNKDNDIEKPERESHGKIEGIRPIQVGQDIVSFRDSQFKSEMVLKSAHSHIYISTKHMQKKTAKLEQKKSDCGTYCIKEIKDEDLMNSQVETKNEVDSNFWEQSKHCSTTKWNSCKSSNLNSNKEAMKSPSRSNNVFNDYSSKQNLNGNIINSEPSKICDQYPFFQQNYDFQQNKNGHRTYSCFNNYLDLKKNCQQSEELENKGKSIDDLEKGSQFNCFSDINTHPINAKKKLEINNLLQIKNEEPIKLFKFQDKKVIQDNENSEIKPNGYSPFIGLSSSQDVKEKQILGEKLSLKSSSSVEHVIAKPNQISSLLSNKIEEVGNVLGKTNVEFNCENLAPEKPKPFWQIPTKQHIHSNKVEISGSSKLEDSEDVFKKPTMIEQTFDKKIVTINNQPYEILRLLGKGGSSEVYEVIEPRSSKVRAIKFVNLAAVEDCIANGYLNEVEKLLKLQASSRVIKMFDYEYVDKTKMLYVVMERGDTDFSKLLKDMIKNKENSMSMIMYYWFEMLKCVKVIHDEGIIHSDLKPANFLLVAGRLKLIDFGIASNIQGDMTSVIKDSVVGTFNYMSPESVKYVGENGRSYKITYKSDIWSLGCILYNMIYGKTPYSHITNQWAKLRALADPTAVVELPKNGRNILIEIKCALLWCLMKDPKSRPSAADLIKLFDNLGVSCNACWKDLLQKCKKEFVNFPQMIED